MRTWTKSLLLAASLCGVGPALAAEAPVKIGLLLTTSGNFGSTGEDQRDGFLLAVEQEGGKLGGVPVEIVRKDDQSKPEVTSQLAQELIEKDKVALIAGTTGSHVLMGAYKKIVDSETILISSLAGTAPIAGAMCSPYFFSVFMQNDMISEGIGQYANQKGYKKMYLLAPNFQGGKDIVAGFKRYYKGEISGEVYTQLGQQDYLAEIAALRAAKPDAVMLFLPSTISINFVKQYAQAGLQGKVPLISASTNADFLPAMGDAGTGLLLSSVWEASVDNPVSKKFVADFTARYKHPPSTFAAMSYDSALLIASALKKTRGNVSDKKALIAALQEANFKSVRGNFKFNTNHFPITDWYMFEVAKDPKDGRPYFAMRGTTMTAHKDAYYDKCSMK